jgi:hypothetical protein
MMLFKLMFRPVLRRRHHIILPSTIPSLPPTTIKKKKKKLSEVQRTRVIDKAEEKKLDCRNFIWVSAVLSFLGFEGQGGEIKNNKEHSCFAFYEYSKLQLITFISLLNKSNNRFVFHFFQKWSRERKVNRKTTSTGRSNGHISFGLGRCNFLERSVAEIQIHPFFSSLVFLGFGILICSLPHSLCYYLCFTILPHSPLTLFFNVFFLFSPRGHLKNFFS